MKLGIIGGGGQLGGTTAYQVAMTGLADEIILNDTRDNIAKSHVMDIEQAKSEYSDTRIRYGELDEMAVCDIILSTAGVPSVLGSRDLVLDGNAQLAKELGERIKSWGSNPVLICATNPADVISYKFFKASGLAPERCIGFSRNDTVRFKWAIEMRMGISARKFEAHVVGEHGDYQVPLFSSVKMLDTGEPIVFTAEDREWIKKRVFSWLEEYQGLRAPRSSPWTSAANLSRIMGLMLSSNDEICCCSVIPNGEYGLRDLSISLPIRLGPNGVREIVKLDITDEEREGLENAAKKISDSINK